METPATDSLVGLSLEAAIDRVLTDCKRGIFPDNPPFVPTPAPNIGERIDAEIEAWNQQRTDPDRFCDHGTPVGSHCGRCAALGEMTASNRLFATAAELGVPPVAPGDADLSRIRVAGIDRFSPEGEAFLRKRAERKAKYDRINGTVDLTGLRSL